MLCWGTATIFADYLEQGRLEMDKSRKPCVAVATALLQGIITDTSGFLFGGPEDFHAAVS